ncbi:MAG: MarR family transcriptional regulator [Algisphaera sp.]
MVGKLAKQLKKRNDFDSVQQAVTISLLRTNDLFQHRFGKLFRDHGLTQPQYNILRILYGEGKKLPSLEIASRMITVVPAITGLIDKLETKGLVTRERCDQDRRVCYIALSTKGKKEIEKMKEPVVNMHQRLVGHLSNKDATQLFALLEKLRDSKELEQRQA